MIVSTYAAILGLFFITLSLKVISARRKYQVALGDNSEQALQRAIRVHGNFSEYVPITLVLLYFAESTGVNSLLIHSLCLALCVGRLSHAYGVSSLVEELRYRIFGMVLTMLVIIFSALIVLYMNVFG